MCYKAKERRAQLRALRHNSNLPTMLEIILLLGREPKRTLYMYLWALGWKLVLFIKLTVGYWDRELIETMKVHEVSERFDEDPLDDNDRDGDTLRILGMSHVL